MVYIRHFNKSLQIIQHIQMFTNQLQVNLQNAHFYRRGKNVSRFYYNL